MKKRLLVSASLLLFATLAPVTVHAQTDSTDPATTAATAREAAKEKAANARKNKDVRMAEIKTKIEVRKAQLKLDACERNATRIQQRQERITENAAKIKGVFDRKYDRLVEFYESGQLTAPDYDALVEAIELAKANVETSMETLSTYEFVVDCESEDAAADLDSYREAVAAVKTDLKAYKKSLVDLVSSLKSANAQENREGTEGDGGEGTETEETENESTEGETENE